jgi:cytochrome c oxidase assembly factor CtaG
MQPLPVSFPLSLPVSLTDWSAEPGVVIPLAIATVLYAVGLRRLRHARRGVRLWEIAAFAGGIVLTALALLSPLHEASEELFSAHMVQHELLMAVVAPLLIVGRPGVVMLWAFPSRARHRVATLLHAPPVRATWRFVARPMDAWAIHGAAIWLWHLPMLFQATLRSETMHALQHASFLGSALLFWWAILHPPRRAALGLSILLLFTTAVHTAVLGALMTFARAPWYPDYASGALRWGLTPIADQQLAGLVMWIPASFAYLGGALVVLRRWLAASEIASGPASDWTVTHDTRAELAS